MRELIRLEATGLGRNGCLPVLNGEECRAGSDLMALSSVIVGLAMRALHRGRSRKQGSDPIAQQGKLDEGR